MKLRLPKRWGWILTGIIVALLVVLSMLPNPVKVDVTTVSRGPLQQSVDAEGMTRLTTKYLISLPVTGTVTRIALEPGDSVRAGQTIAHYTPPTMDERQRASATARAEAAAAMEIEAKNGVAALRPMVEMAKRTAERNARLVEAGALPKEQAQSSQDNLQQLEGQYEAAQARVKTASYEARAARIAASAAPGQSVPITSPIDGVVLRRYEDQERTLMAGAPLLELGDTRKMEVVIDVLSTDAVRIKQGMSVAIEGWGGGDTLVAVVRTIEPAARVKVSSLGVEEKRVNVIAALPEAPLTLGDTYKVDARVILWEGADVTQVPLSAIFRSDGEWYVFKVTEGTAVRTKVKVGHRSGLTAEIVSGLESGDVVVVHPPEELQDGQSIEVRS